MKANLLVKQKLCVGCSACVLACSFAKETEFSPSRARIHISRIAEKGVDMPVVCRHCANASCIEACEFNAITRDEETGLVCVCQESCTGCGSCLEACPFGAITLHPDSNIAITCDLCDGAPECVKYCVTGALTYRASPATKRNATKQAKGK